MIADRLEARLETRIRRLGDVPFSGPSRDDLSPGLRLMPFERKGVIAYTVTETVVEILNISFGGWQVDAFHREDEDPPAG